MTPIIQAFAPSPSPPVLSPIEGTLGTEISITGSGFGARKGKIYIEGFATKIVGWEDATITCFVNRVMPAGLHNVNIQPQSYRTVPPQLLASAFTIKNPEIDPLSIDHGSPGNEITITGRFFATRKGKVYFEYGKNGQIRNKSSKVRSWTMDPLTGASDIIFFVPKGISGQFPLKIMNQIGTAETTFTIS